VSSNIVLALKVVAMLDQGLPTAACLTGGFLTFGGGVWGARDQGSKLLAWTRRSPAGTST
jgi:hypothetical protein